MLMENYTIFHYIFFEKYVEQLHNYMIVNGLFYFSLSLSWCVKCQNMCIKKVVVSIFRREWNRTNKKKLSVGLRSSITARSSRRVVISKFQCFIKLFSVFRVQNKHIVSKTYSK